MVKTIDTFSKLIIIIFTLAFSYQSFASVGQGQSKGNEKFSASYFTKKINSGSTVAKVYGIDKTVAIKFKNPTDATKINSTSGGTFKGDVDGVAGNFYCVDLFHYVQWYTTSNPHTYTDNGVVDTKIIYILNNYYPFKAYPYTGSASSVQVEAAAVQVALWHYSDGADANTVDNVNVKTRALQIISDADANYSSFYPFETLLLVPTNPSVKNGDAALFFVSTFDGKGNPIGGITVNLSSSSGVLSSASVTTGSDGNSPIVTLTSSSNSTATVTASATVKINLGTRYVHSVEPDKWQKLVLASPSGISRTASTTFQWYTPANCDTKGFTTFTQGGWGNTNGTPGRIRDQYFTQVFPTGLVVGGNYKLTLTTSTAVKNFLPQGGTAGAFTQNYSNVTSTSAGVLGGQLVALKCNVEYDAKGFIGTNSTAIKDLQIASGPFAGKTVTQFLALLETAIGGGSLGGYTFDQYNTAATAINENFDNGTVDKGFLTCATVNVKASLGDKVWLDANKNGVQDSGESGVAGVTVKLYDCNNNLKDTKTTDANGNYLFADLNPGDYYVKFELPSGYLFTSKDSGSDDAKDSDADISTGKTTCTTLVAGENDLTWDAGIYQEACKSKIGDYVWRDKNINGIQDAGEPGIQGVVVELVQNNIVLSSSTTDAAGKYEFTNLVNGSYSVRVAASNYNSGGVLYSSDATKWYATKKNQGNDDAKDSDANKNESVSVTLNCGDNITIDFGFYKTCISVTKTASKPTAKVGDKITYTIVVENCGDVQHHGGIDVFDKMLNPTTPYKIKHIDLLNPNGTSSFTMDYTVKNGDCGDLINEVIAEGHPTDGSAYVTAKATATVKVDCGTPCTTEWGATVPNDQPTCEYGPKEFTVTGNVSITPKPSAGYLVTTWRVIYPNDGSVDNSVKTTTTEITGDTNFEIKIQWPGIRPADQLVEVQYTVLVLDCNKNPLGKEVTRKYYWNTTVCPPPPSKEADVKIEKTSSVPNPKCGDSFAYTVKVTNLGPAEAKAVQVTDLLPEGIQYISSSASSGSYNNSNGLWNVGDLANGSSATLTINIKADCELANNSTFDLGVAKNYNLFVIQDANQPSSDTEGKVAVGRDASFGNYSMGDKLPENSGDVLIVGRDLTFTSGRVYNGNVVYGNNTNLPIGLTSIDGTLRKDNVINFAAAKTYLENLSASLAAYTVNGITKFQFSTLSCEGTDPYLNVFKVSVADLNNARTFNVSAPNGSAVLVNVEGDGIIWSGGLEVYGTAINNVLYNFYQATNIKISNIDVRGTVLAPFAAVDFPSGVQNGQMICKSLTGRGQFNFAMFFGNIPPDKKITNIAAITGSLTSDPVASNNSASNTIDLNKTNVNPNNGNSAQTSGSTWQEVGSFTSTEIVYSMVYDNNTTYSGTMGGKIYKSNNGGKNWTRINNDMNVGWIWSLILHNGTLCAATEKGVYKYSGTTWTLTSLKDIDVRALASSGTTLYAGTWGKGVYCSNDNGNTWSEINTDLTTTAIQSMTVGSNGDVFAGSAGGGLFKLFKGESKWYHYDVGNNIVSSLSATKEGVLASTYGGGLYRSIDNGSNWEKTNLDQPYIYSIIADKNNKAYVSSYTSGVFASKDNGSDWKPLGMGGVGVSSLVTSSSAEDVYAGTKDGKIYKITFKATDVESDNNIPAEFRLAQNYPNPFNPTTTIEFALPISGKYSLKIYNILGQEVTTLVNKDLTAGMHKIKFDAGKYASGVYIYQLSGSNVTLTKKMLLIK